MTAMVLGGEETVMVGEVAKVVVYHRPSLFYALHTYSYICKVNGSFGIWMKSSVPEPYTYIPVNSFPSMAPYTEPISTLYFAGENHCVLTFTQLFYKCKDKYFIY